MTSIHLTELEKFAAKHPHMRVTTLVQKLKQQQVTAALTPPHEPEEGVIERLKGLATEIFGKVI